MTVWVVIAGDPWTVPSVKGVFSTEAAAEQFLVSSPDHTGWSIERHEVQQ